jgi:hypothetical protein
MVSGLAIYEGNVRTHKPRCSILAVKMFSQHSFAGNSLSRIARAVQQFKERCRVFNLSFASQGPDPTSTRALDHLSFNNNVLFVAAAGNILPSRIIDELNLGRNYPDYIHDYHIYFPGDCYNVLTVGSYAEQGSNIAPKGCPSPFTRSRHPYTSKVSPEMLASGGNLNRITAGGNATCSPNGCGIVSTAHTDDDLREDAGTSFSSPVVSSTVAQLIGTFPNHWPCFYKALLVSSCNQLSDTSQFPCAIQGFGVPNRSAAFNSEYWRATLCAESAFDLRDMKRYHRYRFFFPDGADRILVTICFDVEPITSRFELPYYLSIRVHKPATKKRAWVKPASIIPDHESNIKRFEYRVQRGGKATWTIEVTPHLRDVAFIKPKESRLLRYSIIITIISDRRAWIYSQILSAAKKMIPSEAPRPLVPAAPVIATAR